MELTNHSKLFVISDTHFCHNNIIKYCNRPFVDADQMNEAIISNWNNVVSSDDVVLHLGDITAGAGKFKDEKSKEIVKRLNGNIIFIRGNHDEGIKSFKLIDNLMFHWNGVRIYCSHYPVYNFKNFGDFHLYGHVHQNSKDYKNSFNCSVENINYTPIRLQEIISKHYES